MNRSNWRYFDFWLLGAVALLTIFGIMMIRSSVAGNIELSTDTNLVNRQILFAVVGFVVVFIIAAMDYRFFSGVSQPLYWITAVFLAILTIAGQALYGSARWFDTGVILIQPSEIAKIVVIITLAEFFARNKHRLDNLVWVGISFLYTIGIVAWILLQPNLSTSLVILVIWFAMLWGAGLRMKHLLLFIVMGMIIPFAAFPVLEEYQQKRILNFLFPDPQQSYGETYNLDQALIAIGSGGMLGQGYGQGTQVQLRFLKVRWSDFIFSVIAQELGFVGVVLMMALILFVIIRILSAARKARDTFGALVCYGVATLIAFQAFVNMGVNLRLIPATGLTLPFVSYGGSSLLSLLIGVGLVQSVLLHQKNIEF